MEVAVNRRALYLAFLPLFAGILGVLSIPGCSDDEAACRPEVPAGRFQGRVRTGGASIAAVVSAAKVSEDAAELAIFESEPDSAGWYALDVPAGRYVLSLRVQSYRTVYTFGPSGLRFGTAPPETLTIDTEHPSLVADFNLSSVRVSLRVPPGLEGQIGTIHLHRRGFVPDTRPTYVDRAGGFIADSALDLTIAGVLPGQYKIEADLGPRSYCCNLSWDGEHFWLPAARDSTAASWIDVPVDQMLEVSAQVPTQPARMEGEITGAWRDLLMDPPAVVLVTPDSSIVRGLRQVEADGSFAVDLHLPGPVKVLVDHEGIRQWIGGTDFETVTVFSMESGQTISGVRLVESALRVDFPDPAFSPGQPSLRLFHSSDRSPAAALELPSSEGPFLIPNLRPGEYLLRVEPHQRGSYTTWVPQWYDRASRGEEARLITIDREGVIVRIAVNLERGGRIQGVVLGPEENHLIYLTPADEQSAWTRVFSGAAGGDFDMEGIPDGAWKIGAWRSAPGAYPDEPPPDTVWYPGTRDWNSAGIVSITAASEVLGIEIAPPESRNP